jgi:hypothetical protein
MEDLVEGTRLVAHELHYEYKYVTTESITPAAGRESSSV